MSLDAEVVAPATSLAPRRTHDLAHDPVLSEELLDTRDHDQRAESSFSGEVQDAAGRARPTQRTTDRRQLDV